MSSYTFTISYHINFLNDLSSFITTNFLKPTGVVFNPNESDSIFTQDENGNLVGNEAEIGGTCILSFESSLTDTQQTNLQSLLNSYPNPTSISVFSYKENIISGNFSENGYLIYSNISAFTWEPSDSGILSAIEILTFYIGNSYYKLRIYDATNNNVIAETPQISQKNYSVTVIDNLNHIPTSGPIVIEIQILVGDLVSLNLKSCVFVYNKVITK